VVPAVSALPGTFNGRPGGLSGAALAVVVVSGEQVAPRASRPSRGVLTGCT